MFSFSFCLVLLYVFTRIITSNSHYLVNTVYGGLGCPIKTPKAYFIYYMVWVQASRLLDCLPVSWSVAAGTREPILGWLGMVPRYPSRASLNSPRSLLIFLILLGKLLNNLAPLIWKLLSLIVCIPCLPFFDKDGILIFLPNLGFSGAKSTLQFGAYPSKIFQMYIILYLSILLSWEDI